MQQNTANRKDQLEPGQREKGNTVFGSHPLLAQHDAQGQHCACSTDEDAAHSHPCVGFLNTRSCEHPPPSYHAAQLSYSELFLSVHNSHLLREPFTIVAYNFFFSSPPRRMKNFNYSRLTSPCSLWAYLQTATGTLKQTVHGKALLSPVLCSQNTKQSSATTVTNEYLMDISLAWSSMSRTLSNLPVPKSFLREQKVHGFFNKVCLHNKTCNPITFPPILLSWKLRPFLLEKNHWLMKFDNILSHWKLRSFSRKCWAILEDLYNNTWGRFEEQGWASTSGASL